MDKGTVRSEAEQANMESCRGMKGVVTSLALTLLPLVCCGCLQLGARILGDDWGDARNQFQCGFETPFLSESRNSPLIPESAIGPLFLEFGANVAGGFGGKPGSVNEISLGLCQGAGFAGMRPGRVRGRTGAGFSYMSADFRQSEADPPESGEAPGAYVYYEIQRLFGPVHDRGIFGLKFRYTLAFTDAPEGMSPGGLQVLVTGFAW
jgi:hypothetical protein